MNKINFVAFVPFEIGDIIKIPYKGIEKATIIDILAIQSAAMMDTRWEIVAEIKPHIVITCSHTEAELIKK